MNPAMRPVLAIAATMGCAASTTAQDLLPKAAPQQRPVVIEHAVLHTMEGALILDGTIWFSDGLIRGVLPRAEPPRLPAGVEALRIDGTQKHVVPGLIAAFTQLGLQEIGMVRQTVDTAELGDCSPEAMAAVAVNPDSTAIPVARSNGVLVAGVFPSGGSIPGRAAVIQLDGWTNADLTLLMDAGLVVAWPADTAGGRRGRRGGPAAAGAGSGPTSVTAARRRIDDEFTRARAWLDASLADETTAHDLRARAMVPALRGDVPVFLLADELEQIESAVLWAVGRNLRAIVVGGRDAPSCAELLVRHRVPVIVTGTHKLPHRDDLDYDAPFRLPARLAAAGIRFCLATGESFSNERNLPFHAATAAAFGLDRERALAAITRDAAAILGIDDRVGSLAVGKHATLLLTDGNPLDLTTRVERAWIQGREVDLRNKHTELARKYRERYRQLGTGR